MVGIRVDVVRDDDFVLGRNIERRESGNALLVDGVDRDVTVISKTGFRIVQGDDARGARVEQKLVCESEAEDIAAAAVWA